MKKMAVKILWLTLLLGALFASNVFADVSPKETSRSDVDNRPVDFSNTEVVDGKIYIFGRKLSRFYPINHKTQFKYESKVYDPSTDTWTSLASIPIIRHPFTTEVVNGKIYAIEGFMKNDNAVNMVVYDPSTDTWSDLPPMPTPRLGFWTEVLDGKLYVIGGGKYEDTNCSEGRGGKLLSSGSVSNEVKGVTEVYDPSTDTWATLASMPTNYDEFYARSNTQVIDGKIYVMGMPDMHQKAFLEVYDPTTDTWTTLSSMPTARIYFETEVVDGKIYVIGGYSPKFKELFSIEAYDPTTDTWTTLPSMPTARSQFETEVIDGKFYAIGGWNSHSELLKSIEVYDHSKNTWTTLAPTENIIWRTEVIDRTIYCIGWNEDGITMESYNVNANGKNEQK
ncbi:MAG: kelch repeat-containing protein [Lachnospiraceae bacterium]|nr:kelch repeat-containing protein [Lachnospiraceae bacterium]